MKVAECIIIIPTIIVLLIFKGMFCERFFGPYVCVL